MITVACVLRQDGKVGYDATWVDKLQNAVKRHLTIPHRFVCLSDCAVECERIPLGSLGSGYWAKLQLFQAGLFDTPVLYLDLDTLICNNIDELVERCLEQDKFVMWRDPDYNISSSAIMFWSGDYSGIFNSYALNHTWYEDRYSTANQGAERLVGDQAVISSMTEHVFINDLCPKNWIHIASKRDAQLDLSETRILIFRKPSSKPSNMPTHDLVKKHWL